MVHVVQAGLEPSMWYKIMLNFDPPASTFTLLGLQACAPHQFSVEVVTEPSLPNELYLQPKMVIINQNQPLTTLPDE